MEIKKAWEQMKKDLKKETGIEGGFTLNAKQLKNRTATYSINNIWSFEDEIKRIRESMDRVMGYDSWTAEEKVESYNRSLNDIRRYEARMKKYGTKENEAVEIIKTIINSDAFKKFQENIGTKVGVSRELKENFINMIRFYY